MDIWVTLLIMVCVLGMIGGCKYMDNYEKMKKKLKEISKPVSNVIDPIPPVIPDYLHQLDDSKHSQAGNKTDNEPNWEGFGEGVNGLGNTIDPKSEGRGSHKNPKYNCVSGRSTLFLHLNLLSRVLIYIWILLIPVFVVTAFIAVKNDNHALGYLVCIMAGIEISLSVFAHRKLSSVIRNEFTEEDEKTDSEK
jgi:hypothetical protein